MKKALRQQVEAILDQVSEREPSVIVRMAEVAPEAGGLLARLAETLQRRKLATRARELLPAAAEAFARLEEGKGMTAAQRRDSNPLLSLAVAAARAAVSARIGSLRSEGLKAIEPLLAALSVRDLIGRVAVRRRGARPGEPRALWASRSVVLRLRRDDLRKLPEEMPGIADIYPNRHLAMPPVVEAQQLPEAVEDNKASAWGLERIGALAAWGAYGARGKGVKIAVLDTGIDAEHPDLKGKVKDWAEFDFDGRAVEGSTPRDSDRHGTHCAGTVAGGQAGGRWIGVAPEADIAAALVLDGGRGGTDAQVLAGMEWALEVGADVLSMSLGGLTFGPDMPDTYTATMLSALRLGVPVVTAIGNDGHQTSGSPGNDVLAFAVGATDHQDRPAGFSGGQTLIVQRSRVLPPHLLPWPYSKPDISAPGVAVLSSVPGADWAAFNGTSMATPHVAGAIALLLSATRLRQVPSGQRGLLIQELITSSVEELGESGQDQRFGFGRLDVLRAIGFARERGF